MKKREKKSVLKKLFGALKQEMKDGGQSAASNAMM